MQTPLIVDKDPNATLDYAIDWSAWLAGDTISVAFFDVPLGLTKVASSSTTTVATVWLSGGTIGVNYPVVCRITTTGGRIDDRTIVVCVKER